MSSIHDYILSMIITPEKFAFNCYVDKDNENAHDWNELKLKKLNTKT